MQRGIRLALVLGALGIAAGCGSPARPEPSAPVAVSLQPTPTLVGGPDQAAFTAILANTSGNPVDLTFPSSCQVLPYFQDRATGKLVTPVGGGIACATVITRLTLQPSLSVARVFMIKAGTAPDPNAIVLPPGEYAIQARLEDDTYRVQSGQFLFSLR